MRKAIQVNIACGDAYLPGWINYDYTPHSPDVIKTDLLGKLPLSNAAADIVYSSHFFEHIPRTRVEWFLSECFRITRAGGRVRLVMPDFSEMCSTYLAYRQNADHEKADFLLLEIIDQCVRQTSGGELGEYYNKLENMTTIDQELLRFVRTRTGHVIQTHPKTKINAWRLVLNNPGKIWKIIERLYIRALLIFLPPAFRQQNVSLAEVGERHAWIYDYHSVEKLLIQAGFVDVQRMSAATSNIPGFPCYPLDLNDDNTPRKGDESMYLEAVKP